MQYNVLAKHYNDKYDFDLNNKKIFSIYYWREKRSKSSIYYYPSINSNIKNKAFISSFADFIGDKIVQ